MSNGLRVGIQHDETYRVTDEMSPPHLPAKVLSTPSMLMLIEDTCLAAVQSELAENETTVGTHVDLSHTGPAMAGEEVAVAVRLVAIAKRRLSFEFEVTSPRGSISTGHHERAVVDLARFG